MQCGYSAGILPNKFTLPTKKSRENLMSQSFSKVQSSLREYDRTECDLRIDAAGNATDSDDNLMACCDDLQHPHEEADDEILVDDEFGADADDACDYQATHGATYRDNFVVAQLPVSTCPVPSTTSTVSVVDFVVSSLASETSACLRLQVATHEFFRQFVLVNALQGNTTELEWVSRFISLKGCCQEDAADSVERALWDVVWAIIAAIVQFYSSAADKRLKTASSVAHRIVNDLQTSPLVVAAWNSLDQVLCTAMSAIDKLVVGRIVTALVRECFQAYQLSTSISSATSLELLEKETFLTASQVQNEYICFVGWAIQNIKTLFRNRRKKVNNAVALREATILAVMNHMQCFADGHRAEGKRRGNHLLLLIHQNLHPLICSHLCLHYGLYVYVILWIFTSFGNNPFISIKK
jgi:BarA-like signal transduction histidine kinase